MAGHANHDANAAAWAAMRAEQARAAEARRAERAAEKAARREANRAAWWGRMGREVPGAAEATEDAAELAVSRCKVDHVAPAEWHVVSADGAGYTVEGAGFTVSFEGEAYTVPTLKAAAELVELAEQTRRDEADAVAVFEVGMRSEHGGVSYTVERHRKRRDGPHRRGGCHQAPDAQGAPLRSRPVRQAQRQQQGGEGHLRR